MIFSRGKKVELKGLVYDFRKAIETAKANNEPGEFFEKFPYGQCGNTSDILAQYLIDNGIDPIIYVNGTYYGDDFEDRQSHTWLDVKGLIIDITADQFKYYKKPLTCDIPVYIGPKTEFYQLFEIGPESMYEHFGLEKHWVHYRKLKDWYETILKYLR